MRIIAMFALSLLPCATIGAGEKQSADSRPDGPAAPVARARWDAGRAWEWYRSQAWPCGFNYVPANAVSYTEMWMPYCFDEGLIDRELALAEGVGFNCMRVVLPFVVWEHDPAAFKDRLDAFLAICERRGIRVMFCLFDDCAFGPIKDPVYGQQPDAVEGWYANGWTPSPGHSLVRDAAQWPRLEAYVTDVIGAFAHDPRVWVWDLYNEPTNGGLGDASIPLLANVFSWARAVDPDQPLTVALWRGIEMTAYNRCAIENSDIITFHEYGPPKVLAPRMDTLLAENRPLVCTEWLNRPGGCTVAACLPLFKERGVGCLHWGLVNGKTQTHIRWGSRPGKVKPGPWQHDLFHGDHTPYDAPELDLFRSTIRATPGDRTDK